MDEAPTIDTETIDAQVVCADYILLSHSHFNHCMHVPFNVLRTMDKVDSEAKVVTSGP